MELFVGLGFPIYVIEELKCIQKKLRQIDPTGQYEPIENYHLTLRYIGELLSIEVVIALLEQIKHKSFQLQLHELGMFDNPDQNVVWVNVKQENDELQTLQRMIDRTLSNAGGILIERYSFVPHISLAYGCKAAIAHSFSTDMVTPLSFDVTSFHLYEVHQSTAGPRFGSIRKFKLKV